VSSETYAQLLASEHKQGLHYDAPHKMCRKCHPEEAELLGQLEAPPMNIRIDVDAAAINMRWTHAEPDGEFVFRTLKEAKERALGAAIPERDAWASCVRDIREFTLDQVAESWD